MKPIWSVSCPDAPEISAIEFVHQSKDASADGHSRNSSVAGLGPGRPESANLSSLLDVQCPNDKNPIFFIQLTSFSAARLSPGAASNPASAVITLSSEISWLKIRQMSNLSADESNVDLLRLFKAPADETRLKMAALLRPSRALGSSWRITER